MLQCRDEKEEEEEEKEEEEEEEEEEEGLNSGAFIPARLAITTGGERGGGREETLTNGFLCSMDFE